MARDLEDHLIPTLNKRQLIRHLTRQNSARQPFPSPRGCRLATQAASAKTPALRSSPDSAKPPPPVANQEAEAAAGRHRQAELERNAFPGAAGSWIRCPHRPNEVLECRPGPCPAPRSGTIRHGPVGGAGRPQGGRCALSLAESRRAPSVVGCSCCRSRCAGGGGGRRRAGGHSARGRSMAAAVVRRGPAGWWRWHRRVMGKDLPLPSAPVALLRRPGGERPGLSRGAQLSRCPWRPRALRALCSSRASLCGIPGRSRLTRAAIAVSLFRASPEFLGLIKVFTHLLAIACLETIRAHKCFPWQQ